MIGFLDIETGGFSKEKNGVCEIAVVITDLNLQVIDVFHHLIAPYTRPCGVELVSYKEDAMAINGLTVEKLVAEGVPVELVMKFLAAKLNALNVHTMIGHNIPTFDIPRVEYLMNRFAGLVFGPFNVECTMKMAREKLPNLASHKQPDLLEHFGIENPNGHTAKGDAFALIELYKRLTLC